MDYEQLDATLKLLNGFDQDWNKRNEVLNLIKEKGRISIFAYGSLLWNPIDYFDYLIPNCILNDYKKGFFCEDFIYRGNCSFTGLTMGLIKESNEYVHGALLVSKGEKILPFFKSFVQRESPLHCNGTLMDIYRYDLVQILLSDGITKEYAITCIVNQKSLFYFNRQLTLDQQVKKIGRAYGKNGTNFQYLHQLKLIYHQLNINDSFSNHFHNLYEKILLFRTGLSIHSQKCFFISNQFEFFEDKKENSDPSKTFVFSRKQISLFNQPTPSFLSI